MRVRKTTSCGYGREYQLKQAGKFKNRGNNNWKYRIELAKNLVREYALPRCQGKPPHDIVLVDVGCSIGTFAIEFSQMGYDSYGIDFDHSSLEIARQLAGEEGVSPEFVCGDVTHWRARFPEIDVAVCFDLFEHLHDDELGSLLTSIRAQLSQQGSLVFHTHPTQFNYIFFRRAYLRWPLMPFVRLSPPTFDRLVKIYASFLDIVRLVTKGSTHVESIQKRRHCNPTIASRLTGLLGRAGFEVRVMGSSNLYKPKHRLQNYFSRQPITHRNLYGVAFLREQTP